MKKLLLVLLLGMMPLGFCHPCFADDDGDSGDSGDSSSQEVAVNSARNDIIFDSADSAAPLFSKSNESFRAPAAVAGREKTFFDSK